MAGGVPRMSRDTILLAGMLLSWVLVVAVYYNGSSCQTKITTLPHSTMSGDHPRSINGESPPLLSSSSPSSSLPTAGREWFSQSDNNHQGVLIAFAYYEGSEMHRSNTEFFFTVGISPYLNHPKVHFLIILMSDITIDIPDATNVFITRRRNFGMDVCAWNETMRDPLISTLTGRSVHDYRYIIWLNASVRGPFMPLGSPWTAWLPYFLGQINDRDKLIGTSINCRTKSYVDPTLPHLPWGQMHVQSMFLAFDYHLLPYLLLHTPCSTSGDIAVVKGEIEFTRETLRRGYNVVSQMLPYRDVNWLTAEGTNEACDRDFRGNGDLHGGDRQEKNDYYGFTLHPLEMVFQKTVRYLYPNVVDRYSEWAIDAAYKVFPYRPNHRPFRKAEKTYT